MVQWLRCASQGQDMNVHDLNVIGWNPIHVELGLCSPAIKVNLELKALCYY